MGTTKIIGGLLAVIGGIMIIIPTFMNFHYFWNISAITIILNLVIGIVAMISGIIGIKGRRNAGALVMGLLSILFGIIFAYVSFPYGYNYVQFSLFTQIIHQFSDEYIYYLNLFAGISFEAIIITVGGILNLASGSEYYSY